MAGAGLAAIIAVLQLTAAQAVPGDGVAPPESAEESFDPPVAVGPVAGCLLGTLPVVGAAAGGAYLVANAPQTGGENCSTQGLAGLALIVGSVILGPALTVVGVAAGGLVESLLRRRALLVPILGGAAGLLVALIGPAMIFGGGALILVVVFGTVLGPQLGSMVAIGTAIALLTLAPLAAILTTVVLSSLRIGEPQPTPEASAMVVGRRHDVVAVMAY